MQCDICIRTGGGRLPFLCPTDARNRLYESRIQNAQILLENDALEKQVSSVLTQCSEDKDLKGSSEAWNAADVSTGISEKDQAEDRTRQIIAQADELRAKVDTARKEIALRKGAIARRKSDLASASNGIESRRTRQIEEVEKAMRMTKYKWNQGHNTTASSRSFLCGEAAKLYGLRRVRKNGGSEEYRIGGIPIPDLRSLNSELLQLGNNISNSVVAAIPASISTALSHIVHLLVLSTHYLAIRLPAEITLPRRDYPRPTIFSLASSYKHVDIPFPNTTLGHSSNSNPTTSKSPEQTALPHPRPLFVEKPLILLASEDAASYSLFLEGVILLAYDIAWLCKSQGIPVGDEGNPEDICNIGKNLYNVLIGSRPRLPPRGSGQSTPTKNGDMESESEGRKTASLVGRYSHGSSHSFLGSAEGLDFIRSWKLPTPTKLTDVLKGRLMSEVANAEWEMVDQDAWAIDEEIGGDGVVIGAKKGVVEERGLGLGMQSFMSMRTVMDAVEMVGGDHGERKPGTSGWTKLKTRG